MFAGEGDDRSSAELTIEEKNAVSHRARAIGALIDVIRGRYG
ncbi:non-canonical purine NTP pyrophosphatase [Mesorhizobium japonicum]